MSVLAGRPIPALEPGSPEWLGKMSASKVAAALGLSPFESPFSMWHKMAGNIRDQETDVMRRGHYLEPAIAAWFQDQHPDWTLSPGGCWLHADHDWYSASPDRLVGRPGTSETDLLELKSAADHSDEWGPPGSDQIPVGYRAQGMSQMDVTGARRVHFAVLSAYLEFREYMVEYDQAEADQIRGRAQSFYASVQAGQTPPIDGHSQTYETVKRLHPDITAEKIEVGADLARAFCTARHALDAAEDEARRTTSLLADAIGDGREARFLGQQIARRQSKGGGIPYLVAAKGLPTFTESESAA